MKKHLFTIFFLALTCCSLLANDGSYSAQGHGGAIMPVKNNAISMDKETIKIDVIVKKWAYFTTEYDCTFYFTNTTNISQTVLIGFPHKLDAMVGPDYTYKNSGFISTPQDIALENFSFIIDDKEVMFNPLPATINQDLQEVPAYDVVYCVEVTFQPNEKKIIKNKYTMKHWYNGYPNPMGAAAAHNVGENSINYILKSGLTWKNPIGQADIYVTFHTPENFLAISATPKDYEVQENNKVLHFHYKNFTPQEDIKASFTYKKLPFENTYKQIQDYYNKNDYNTVFLLLSKFDCTTINDEKDIKTKDKIRNIAYKTAEKLYRKDHSKVLALYKIALHHCYSFNHSMYFRLNYPSEQDVKKLDFKAWEHEGESNSPCYYITYNLACVYSLTAETSRAKLWYDIALTMNIKLKAFSKTDKDLENFFNGYSKTQEVKYKEMGMTPLMIALVTLNVKQDDVEKLIKSCSDINARDINGKTALMHAANSHPQYIPLLLQNGATVAKKDNTGKTALHYACSRGYADPIKIFKPLLDAGANINAKDKNWKTPLIHYLETSNNHGATPYKNTVQFLLQAGADPEQRDLRGFNTYDVAKRKRREYVFVLNYTPYVEKIDDTTTLIGSRDPDVKTARIRDYEKKGNNLYILYEWGWIIFDLSNLPDCRFIGEYFYKHGYHDGLSKFAVDDNYVYIIGRDDSLLHIFSIKDKKNPIEIKTIKVNKFNSGGQVADIFVKDNYLFCGIDEYKQGITSQKESDEQLICFDINDRENPRRISELRIDMNTLHNYHDSFIFHSYNNEKWEIIAVDTNDKTNMKITSRIDSPAGSSRSFNKDICIDNDNIIFPGIEGLILFKIAEGVKLYPEMNLFNKITDILYDQKSFIYNVFVKNDIVYINNFKYIIDFTDLNDITHIHNDKNQNSLRINYIVDCENHLICLDSNNIIHIYDIKDPLNPLFIKKFIR